MPGPRPACFVLLVGLLTAPAVAADSTPPVARKVTVQGAKLTPADVAKAIREHASIDVNVSALDDDKTFDLNLLRADFWAAVHQLAEKTGSKVVTTGGRIALRPGTSHAPTHISGPFRFAFRESFAKLDAESGNSTYEITLEVCWESGLLAYRIDTTPREVKATNDRGQAVPVRPGGVRALVSTNVAPLTVRPTLTRGDKTVNLKGSIGVTVADKLLTFTFDAANPRPAAAQDGVTATVSKAGAEGGDWQAEVELRHGKGAVTVESHEYELFRNNVLELVSPQGDRYKLPVAEYRDGSTVYGFKNGAKRVGPGWKLEYRTPGPLREVVVPFELRDIRLP